MKHDQLQETRMLLDRRVCELKGCTMAERSKLHPNEHLLMEWEFYLAELQTDRKALCESRAADHQLVIEKHAAELRLWGSPVMRLGW